MSGHIYLDTLNLELHPMPPAKHQKKRALQSGPGRPSQGIRAEYVRTEVYLPTAVRDAFDRLVDRREQQTGTPTSRSDVVRDALVEYLRKHLPEAGI
jgi:hypothetical protein